jgi:hypothetical protein
MSLYPLQDHALSAGTDPVDVGEFIEPPTVQRCVTGRAQDPLIRPEPEITGLYDKPRRPSIRRGLLRERQHIYW